MPSVGLGADWDIPGHDMALGLGGLGGMGICTSDTPKILIITVRDQHGCFPSKSWATVFLKPALNEDGDCKCVVPLPPVCHKIPLSTFHTR